MDRIEIPQRSEPLLAMMRLSGSRAACNRFIQAARIRRPCFLFRFRCFSTINSVGAWLNNSQVPFDRREAIADKYHRPRVGSVSRRFWMPTQDRLPCRTCFIEAPARGEMRRLRKTRELAPFGGQGKLTQAGDKFVERGLTF